jgi:Cytochrome oxidase complex assembly protein 1
MSYNAPPPPPASKSTGPSCWLLGCGSLVGLLLMAGVASWFYLQKHPNIVSELKSNIGNAMGGAVEMGRVIAEAPSDPIVVAALGSPVTLAQTTQTAPTGATGEVRIDYRLSGPKGHGTLRLIANVPSRGSGFKIQRVRFIGPDGTETELKGFLTPLTPPTPETAPAPPAPLVPDADKPQR